MRAIRTFLAATAAALAVLMPAHSRADMLPGLTTVSASTWNQAAVRRVLHVFAYGGQASNWQIWHWSTMNPEVAIAEMLTFDEHNPRLSREYAPDDEGTSQRGGTLRALGEFLSSDDPRNEIRAQDRERYLVDDWGAPIYTFLMAARLRGLNPFRQKIGLWETNYHMAVNRRSVGPRQIITYYDDIMSANAEFSSYHEAMNTAALSAAIARQYGHINNRFRRGECDCNEDFAREYHQLFFGILGEYDTVEHEEVTIKNAAAALAGMSYVQGDAPERWLADQLDYGSEFHPDGPLRILETDINGANTEERITELSPIAVEHPESLENLPLMIVQGLADDELSETEAAALKTAWASMQDKDLLRFLRAYAVSTLFHSANRVKRWSSIDRHLLVANLFAHRNDEHYADFTEIGYLLWDEDITPFEPLHDVFGHQTGLEAAESAEIFRRAYDQSTRRGWRFLRTEAELPGERTVVKDWGPTLKSNNNRSVKHMAQYLWERFIADGFKNFGPLEKAHLHALLATGKDVSALVYPDDWDRVLTASDVARPPVSDLLAGLETQIMALDSADADAREEANLRVGQAVNFIIATPFMFAQEGR